MSLVTNSKWGEPMVNEFWFKNAILAHDDYKDWVAEQKGYLYGNDSGNNSSDLSPKNQAKKQYDDFIKDKSQNEINAIIRYQREKRFWDKSPTKIKNVNATDPRVAHSGELRPLSVANEPFYNQRGRRTANARSANARSANARSANAPNVVPRPKKKAETKAAFIKRISAFLNAFHLSLVFLEVNNCCIDVFDRNTDLQ